MIDPERVLVGLRLTWAGIWLALLLAGMCWSRRGLTPGAAGVGALGRARGGGRAQREMYRAIEEGEREATESDELRVIEIAAAATRRMLAGEPPAWLDRAELAPEQR